MEEWKEYKLGDILCEKGYIRGPFGSALKRGDLLNEGIPVYEQQHAIYNKRDFRFYINSEKYSEMKRFTVCPNDIIVSCSGTVGEVSLIKEHDPIGIISQALLILRVDSNIIMPEFLMYFFKTAKGHNSITARSSGSVQVNIARREVIEGISLLLPDIRTQKKIVDSIKSLDDKIDLNNRINHNLIKASQSLFDYYLVETDSFKGNYKKGALTDIASYLNGIAMQKYPVSKNENGLPVLKIKELGQGCCDTSSDLCTKDIPEQYIINDGDIIFSWSGTLLVDYWCGGVCGLNQHLFKVTSEKFPKWFIYFWTNYHLERFKQIARDKAVTMGHIRRTDLDQAEVLIPNNQVLKNLDLLISPLMKEYVKRRIENRQLQNMRDCLLPELMKGSYDLNC